MEEVVIDASLVIHLVLESPLGERASAAYMAWLDEGKRILAPQLWLNEITSALHRAYRGGLISEKTALESLAVLLDLGVRVMPPEPRDCRRAFRWASRLGQSAAYDGFYLALAQSRHAPLWTGDLRLARRARQIGLNWVHGLED